MTKTGKLEKMELPVWVTQEWINKKISLLEIFFRVRGARMEAEDLAAESLLRHLFSSMRSLPPTAARRDALLATAGELWREVAKVNAILGAAPHLIEIQLTYDDVDELRELFSKAALSPRQRLFLSYRMQGWSNLEIAEVTHSLPSTIATDLYNASRRLRRSRQRLSARRPMGQVSWQTIIDIMATRR